MTKNYIKINGECKKCTLHKECKLNPEGIKHFLDAKSLSCEKGLILDVKCN